MVYYSSHYIVLKMTTSGMIFRGLPELKVNRLYFIPLATAVPLRTQPLSRKAHRQPLDSVALGT